MDDEPLGTAAFDKIKKGREGLQTEVCKIMYCCRLVFAYADLPYLWEGFLFALPNIAGYGGSQTMT
ncbi:hypothetical protein SAMN02745751_03205 [Dethiosulfatibacter aminovorans DSM 17477]|uniref:Uncharacterized protein n=1 Tax=Dethiosulfatibacter aminovorans DSM 17477 TaxID=1121476 RepID=A0A1M6LJY2_9FIRM|nr:hypothetical protein [Dethiosulfatibacter aminovorans]SHJ71482.1 hypothetical protein SAMN02745751_03205 [Dethiosulfatibacter aminovorans DSM 17477]